jgi:hypothetical protein
MKRQKNGSGNSPGAGKSGKASEGNQQPKSGKEPTGPKDQHASRSPFSRLKFGSAGSGGAEFEPGPERP